MISALHLQDHRLRPALEAHRRGLPEDTFVRVVREDPKRKGHLYAGTEAGMFVSFNDGEDWQSLRLNLPPVPITDLAIRQDTLVAATQGRGFWALDDLFMVQRPRWTWMTEPAHFSHRKQP